MIDKKKLLARCLMTGGLLPAVARVRQAGQIQIPILAYHRVWDVAEPDRFPFDLELISATLSDFAWQMQYVRENFTPITFRTLTQITEGGISTPRHPLIITFDDGFDDNYHSVFPILQALDIPATIFLTTSYIDSNNTFWYDRLAYQMLHAPSGTYTCAGLGITVTLKREVSQRRAALSRLLQCLKQAPDERRTECLRYFDREWPTSSPAAPAVESRPLTWNQVREMSAAGIEFGSHTVTHPILANVNNDQLRVELIESKRTIELQVGQTVEAVSYPVGNRAGFTDQVEAMAQQAGYRWGAAYIRGTNVMGQLKRFALNRLHVERDTTRPLFAAMLKLPEIFG